MAIAVIADIHGDIRSLQEAVGLIRANNIDKVICLGDVLHTDADNDTVLTLLFDLGCVFIIGNHDLEEIPKTQLIERYLDKAVNNVSNSKMHFTHYIERNKVTRVIESWQAWNIFDEYDWPLMFIGHNHISSLFVYKEGMVADCAKISPVGPFKLYPDRRYIVSTGSITPGRDYAKKRSFVIYDHDLRSIEFISF